MTLQNVKSEIDQFIIENITIEYLSNHRYTTIMKSRNYNQYCGLAYALEIVGERWTLLVIRELFAGPRRFKDLLNGLPGISTNLLAERLKNLEQQGMIRRRTLPAPAGSTVYEVTPLGQALEKSLVELGRWGSQFVPPSMDGVTVLRLGSYALTFKTFFRPEAAQAINETYELRIDDEVLQVHIENGTIDVEQGKSRKADIVFHTDVPTILGLMQGLIQPDEALSMGSIRVDGDPSALERFLHVCGMAELTDGTNAVPV